MAISRVWQAGAEVDTTNSAIMEFDTVLGTFTESAAVAKSGAYSYSWVNLTSYATIAVPATRQVRLGFAWWVTTNIAAAERLFIRIGGTLCELGPYRGGNTGFIVKNGGAQVDSIINLSTPAGSWTHIGIDVKIDAAAGWVKVYENGTEIMSSVGNTGNSDITSLSVGNENAAPAGFGATAYIDDLYLDDTTGEAAAPVPDLRFEFISPNGVGNYSVWDASPGTGEANWEDVDERPNDGDTTHVEAQVLNERDSYAMTTYTMDTGWAIDAVIATAIARKTDAAVDTEINLMTRQGGVDDDGADQDLQSSYSMLWERFPLDPGGGPWSQADLDSVEIGVRGRGTF